MEMLDNLGRPGRVLLLGGTSEIGLAILAALRAPAGTEVLLAGRDEQRMAPAAKVLPYRCTVIVFDALQPGRHQRGIAGGFAGGPGVPGTAAACLPPSAQPRYREPAP